ncbi:MAG: cytochrome c [Deltaproteobacteria bacterium]|nr:cytochrome c [Deltaproteobacteria bacterium]
MKIGIILLVVAAMALLRWRKVGMLTWIAAWLLGIFVLIRFGFTTPVPMSVVKLYMGILASALIAYIFSDAQRQEQVKSPLKAFLTEKKFAPLLGLVAIAIPTAVAANIYFDMTSPAKPPAFGRTVHPAPPAQINVLETDFDMATLDNPYRHLETDDPAAFQERVANGRVVYYKNCFYCHGDLMAGDGMFIHGLNPIPTNFQDQGTLPILQESFVFWRIAKGAPGLPEEGGPWDSAMPAWENFLTEDEMWDVILFLYDFTGARPRALHDLEH